MRLNIMPLEIPTTKEGLSNLFQFLSLRYNYKLYPSLEAVFQFILREAEEVYYYHIVISGGRAQVHEGKHISPSLRFYSTVQNWLRIITKRINVCIGLLTGKYRIDGELYYFLIMGRIFSRAVDAEVPQMQDSHGEFEIPKKRKWRKPETVLIINASPRKEEGFTYFYLRNLIKGMEAAGARTEFINLYDDKLVVEPCRGCLNCWSKSSCGCVINDGANSLLERINNHYLTIYAFPILANSIPEKLRAILSRQIQFTLPYWVSFNGLTRHPRKNKKERYIALFSTYAFPETKHFAAFLESFKVHAFQSHSPLVAAILRPGGEELFRNVSCREYFNKVLLALQLAGKELMEKGKVSKCLGRRISRTYIPLSNWRRGMNLYWHFFR
ncbi:MAG: NAD(P)H-dependent oxidoreductase [Candidatus Omnitrophota bacterium]